MFDNFEIITQRSKSFIMETDILRITKENKISYTGTP